MALPGRTRAPERFRPLERTTPEPLKTEPSSAGANDSRAAERPSGFVRWSERLQNAGAVGLGRHGVLACRMSLRPAVSGTHARAERFSKMPTRSKAAIFTEIGKPLIVDEIEVDDPGPGECLVKLEATGMCHTELWYIGGGDSVG